MKVLQLKNHNKTIIFAFIVIYCSSCLALTQAYNVSVSDLFATVFFFGSALSAIALLLTKNNSPRKERHFRPGEYWLIPLLLVWIIAYISFGTVLMNHLLPASKQNDDQLLFLFIVIKKLFIFFLVPFACYKVLKFDWSDFGLRLSKQEFCSKRNWLSFAVFSVAVLLFEYFFSAGGSALRENKFSAVQLAKAIPLCFLWLFIEVGLVEEFFYRAVIQSRLTSFLKSGWGGILTSALIFALSHVPGLYLRGGQSEGLDHPLFIWFWIFYCIANMSLAAIALGIVWWRTKNLYLVMALHAMIDLLPNLSSFISTWHL